MQAQRPKQAMIIVLVAMAVTLLAALNLFYGLAKDRPTQVSHLPPDLVGTLLPSPKTLTDFQLTDHHGQAWTLERLRGQWSLLFFGYTHCPDVCPMSMGFLGDVFTHLGNKPFGETKVQGIFISVDPKRDTTDLLRDYVTFFNPGFLGVTGKEVALKELSRQVGAFYAVNPGGTEDAYEVTHSSAFFLIAPTGNLVGVLSPNNNSPDLAAEKIKRIVSHLGGKK
ncbi:MAG: SCO family protein [Magnetococcales bacterium]|nr:SCO family protein [Magnetococcales bacterium]